MTATIETEQPQRAELGDELDDANSNDLEAIDEPENLDGDDGDDEDGDPLDRIRFPKSLLKRVIKERMKREVSSVQVRTLQAGMCVSIGVASRSHWRLLSTNAALDRSRRTAWRRLKRRRNSSSTT